RPASWMQSTGQTSTHVLSLRSMHGSAITYVISAGSDRRDARAVAAEAQLDLEPVGGERQPVLARAERRQAHLVELPARQRFEGRIEIARRLGELLSRRQLAVERARRLLAAGPVDRAQAPGAEAELEQLAEHVGVRA